jgi:hypothetical protein
MFAFLKSIVLGSVLAFVVSLFIGSGGSHGGMLNVRGYTIEGVHFYWSWALFVAGAGLSFLLFMLME